MKTLPILLAAAVLGIALGRGVPTAQAAQAERPVRLVDGRCYVEYHGGVYLDGPCTIAFMGRVGAPVGNSGQSAVVSPMKTAGLTISSLSCPGYPRR